MNDIPPPPHALAAARQQQHHPHPHPHPHPLHQPLSADSFAPPPPPPPPPPPASVPRRQPVQAINGGVDEDDGEIICICGMRHDDGFSVQCETCNNWQHMICYYPSESDRPGEHQKHYCVDCEPRYLDADQARERQEKQIRRQALENGSRRPGPKGHRRKTKDSPALVNGMPQQARERKSTSPRDQPPPAKRPKTSHRSSLSVNQIPANRKRNGTIGNARSASPDSSSRPIIPWYSDDFCQLYAQTSSHAETETNLMNNIAVTNSLSEWLKDPVAVEKDTHGLGQNDIFLRWDGPFEDMPGRPEVALHWEGDPRFTEMPTPPRWPCLTVEQDISKRTFIGELRGHIGYKDEYMNDPDSRWSSLRHAEPFVFFHPQLPIFIDARQEGTIFRYVRRSCKPNAEIQTIITDGTNYHFCFMATKDLLPGEEITVAWQTDDTIKAMYAERGVVHGDVPADIKYAIAMWVSNVLANCGPCACDGNACLMARFDRRGHPQPPEPVPAAAPKPGKPRKKKLGHQISPEDPNRNSNSRSGSEIRQIVGRMDHEDELTDTRSVSGSYQGSGSRDITPNTHYSAVVPEMSERERKKLMREEEMFRRQEEESGRAKKKRHSGAPSLQPPSGMSSSSKQSSEPSSSSRRGTVTKRPPKPINPDTTQSSGTDKPQPSNYVDSAVQCDMDNDEPPHPPMPTPPKRKQYLSVTQRLLRRCASNNLSKRKADSETLFQSPMPDSPPAEAMDIDKERSPKSITAVSDVTPISPVSIRNHDSSMVEDMSPRPARLSPAFGPVDSDMKDVDEEPSRTTPPPHDEATSSTYEPSPGTQKVDMTSHPPMDPPPPPWSAEVHPASPDGKTARPEIRLSMQPSFSSSSSMGLAESPVSMASGLSAIPLFSPSVTAAVHPSPARKKMSLSDYTKRSKAKEPRDISPAGNVMDATTGGEKEGLLQGSAVSDSPVSEHVLEASTAGTETKES